MYRATTPTHIFDIGTEASALSKILITYKQNGSVILEKDKDAVECDGNLVKVKLTQEETNLFQCNKNADVQIRIKTEDGTVMASSVMNIYVNEILNEEVL